MRHPSLPRLLAPAVALALLAAAPAAPPPTEAEARAFLEKAEARLLERNIEQQRAQWVQQNFITEDTETIAAEANQAMIAAQMELAGQARRFEGLALPPELARKFLLLKLSLTLPAPSAPAEQAELAQLAATLDGLYGKGKYCPPGKDCLDVGALSRILAESRDPEALLDAWRGWRTISPPMRPKYQRFVELANKGARELGFADMGALWRSGYDMPPEAFSAELARLWTQVEPLYASLHAYVRTALGRRYGTRLVPEDGPIPAHLLGNMWAQEWGNVYPLVAPEGPGRGYDIAKLLEAKGVDAAGMVRDGEGFFTSLGFEPLPRTFWSRSLFLKPRDRDVVCHASAWDIDFEEDLRIKVCLEVTEEDFVTVHHELGHNFYQRAYRRQPFLFRDSANDGFHEAIGDTIALSVTPAYLRKIGLLEHDPPPGGEIGMLLRQALDKVAFLPFGLMIDQWRWKVFSGETPPSAYNESWWELREKYQGVGPPAPRSEADFDPGAKYHVPGNVPYTRYFLARILQFQFHRALCRAAGDTGPLHLCSIYGKETAGAKLARMLEMGKSRPWPEALEAMTGEKQMDAGAMLEYFAPLKAWLDQQNQGHKVGY